MSASICIAVIAGCRAFLLLKPASWLETCVVCKTMCLLLEQARIWSRSTTLSSARHQLGAHILCVCLQVYLLRCADEGVGVEVVFTTWQLLCVLGRLLWAMVVAAFITPLQSGALHLWEACLHSHLVHLLKQACWRAREALGGHCGVQQVGPVYISLSRSSSISGLSLASSSRGSRGRGGGSSGGSSPAVSRRGTGGGASA
jgi:uncharacterized membrane protein YgcG